MRFMEKLKKHLLIHKTDAFKTIFSVLLHACGHLTTHSHDVTIKQI